jgi:hypothetical protein
MCCGAPQCPALSQAEAWRQPTPDKPSNVLLFPSSEDCDGARCCVVQRGERPATVRITVDFVV